MSPRRYHLIWRLLAAAVSAVAVLLLVRVFRGEVKAPDWAATAGLILVLLWLPFVAITGRAPAWLERMMRRDV